MINSVNVATTSAKKVTGIQLTLTLEQAFYLKQILRSVCGQPDGPRGQMDSILWALSTFNGEFEDLDIPEFSCNGSIVLDQKECQLEFS